MKVKKIKIIYQSETINPEVPVSPAPETELEFPIDNVKITQWRGKKEVIKFPGSMVCYEPNGRGVLLLISAPDDIREELQRACTEIVERMIDTK